jgi:hypothetical protein
VVFSCEWMSFSKSLIFCFTIEKRNNKVHTSYAKKTNIEKEQFYMKKVLSLILILLLALTACGTAEKEETATPEENKTEEGTNAAKENENTREYTAEDEKFSKLIIEKKYDEVVKETVSLKSESQKDFYYIASAFIKNNENQTKTYDPADLNGQKTDYQVIVNYLNRAKFIPDEIKAEVDGLKKAAEDKVAEIESQETK